MEGSLNGWGAQCAARQGARPLLSPSPPPPVLDGGQVGQQGLLGWVGVQQHELQQLPAHGGVDWS